MCMRCLCGWYPWARLRTVFEALSFHRGSWALNSGSQACVIRTLTYWDTWIIWIFISFFVLLGNEPNTSLILGKCTPTEPSPQLKDESYPQCWDGDLCPAGLSRLGHCEHFPLPLLSPPPFIQSQTLDSSWQLLGIHWVALFVSMNAGGREPEGTSLGIGSCLPSVF